MLVANGLLEGDLLEAIRRGYPAPIAQAARRLQAASDEAPLTEALSLGQTLIITLGTVALAWGRRRYVLLGGIKHWHEKFERSAPALGDWLGAAKSGAELASRMGAPLSGLDVALGGEGSTLFNALAEMIKLRNGYVRSPPTGGSTRAAQFTDYASHLRPALEDSSFLASARFVVVEGSELLRDGFFRIAVRNAVGEHPLFLRDPPFSNPEPLYARTAYLLQEPGDDLDLTPFWIATEDDDGGWELRYLNKRLGRRFEYLSFSRPGEKLIDEDLPRVLHWFEHGSGSIERYRKAQSPPSLLRATGEELPVDRIDLGRLFRMTTASMLQALRVDTERGDKGWNHNLGLPQITIVSTAFGLRIMRLIRDDFSLFRSHEVVETLWRRQLPGGCWTSASQRQTARPEATASVLLALVNEGEWDRARQVAPNFLRLLEPYRDKALWGHVWSMALAMPALSTLEPESLVLEAMVEELERSALRDGRGRILGWSRFTEQHPGFLKSAAPSAAHTARVLLALRHCHEATDRRLASPPDELQSSVQWLLSVPRWDNLLEEIERPVDKVRSEILIARHFTRAWAARALLEFEVHPYNDRIRSTVGEVYTSQEEGLWDWTLPVGPIVRKPIWATLDALRLLTTYAFRSGPS
jgi:hypothetical protein